MKTNGSIFNGRLLRAGILYSFLFFLLAGSCTSYEERRTDYYQDRSARIAASLTDAELVGQVLMISLRRDLAGSAVDAPIREMDSDTLAMIQEIQPGGILLYGENLSTIDQTAALNSGLQSGSDLPLWIAIDEEGGVISRLDSAVQIANTPFVSNQEIAETGDPDQAYTKGWIIGRELSGLGINMNFSPIADLNTNPDNPIIGTRAYGADPELAGQMVAAEVTGLQQEGVAAVLKHYPGHGDTRKDSHHGAVSVSHDLERLRSVEFVPFLKGAEALAAGIMVGHISVPAVTGDDLPATFSNKLLVDILRGELGYKGLIISDSMGMGAITIDQQEKNAVVEAFKAGIDVILNPPHPQDARDALLTALYEGDISREQLEQSVIRILNAKQSMGLWDVPIDLQTVYAGDLIGSEAHRQAASMILAPW